MNIKIIFIWCKYLPLLFICKTSAINNNTIRFITMKKTNLNDKKYIIPLYYPKTKNHMDILLILIKIKN